MEGRTLIYLLILIPGMWGERYMRHCKPGWRYTIRGDGDANDDDTIISTQQNFL